MEIRIAKERDIEKVAELMQINGYDREGAVRRANGINSPNKRILVSEENSDLLGYTGIKKESEQFPVDFDMSLCAQILWVGVHPDFRHRSFGSRLVRTCDDIALEFERQNIALVCREAVIPFYERNGYNVAGNYVDEKSRLRFVMHKSLNQFSQNSYS
jgi:ribosomal protein S18 acetylase RimI-like enzyme